MSKSKPVSLPPGMIEAAGIKYLRKRPSFVQLSKRLAKKGFALTDAQYKLLMLDVRSLEDLLALSSVDESVMAVQKLRVNNYAGYWQVRADLLPKTRPEALPKPPDPVAFYYTDEVPEWSGMEALIIPDIHFGYYMTEAGTCKPTHDESCVAIYLAVARLYQPKVIVVEGDLFDFPTLSTKFASDPVFMQLLNYVIRSGYLFLAALRAACPNARIVYIEGNHEKRLREYVKRLAPELLHLKREGDDQPMLSVPYLLRLGELGVEYVGPYGEHVWFPEFDARGLHGEKYGSSGGETVAKMLKEYPGENSFCGHVHRCEHAMKTSMIGGVRRVHWAIACGTGALIDGTVPGPKYADWQNGFGAIWQRNRASVHEIVDGAVVIAGRVITVNEQQEVS